MYDIPQGVSGLPQDDEEKVKRRFLLLTLPVPLVVLVIYIALAGQIKLSGIIVLGLFLVLLECIAVFLHRCVAIYQRRRDEP